MKTLIIIKSHIIEKGLSLKNICDIKDSEIPIMLIAVGNLPDEFDVACSHRFPYNHYTKFYN